MADDHRTPAWDQYWATVEGQLSAGPSGFVRWALPYLQSAPGTDLVEVGSGAGRDMGFLLEQGFSVRGVDFSSEAVRIARQFLATLAPGVSARGHVEVGEAGAYVAGLPEGSLSGVVGLVLYETFSDPERTGLFRGIARALRPGGVHLWCVRDDAHPLREKVAMVPPNQGGPSGRVVEHTFFARSHCDALTSLGFERVALEPRPETHYFFVADRKPVASVPQ